MRRGFLIATVVTITMGICVSASAQKKPEASAYDKLDSGKLSEVLTDMGMTELLRTLVSEQGNNDSPDAKMQLAQLKIREAEQQRSPEVRNRMLDDAITLLEDAAKIIQARAEELAKAAEDEDKYTKPVINADKALVESYKARFKVLEVMGLSRTERYASRLVFLRGGDADRKVILRLTDEVVKPLQELNEDIRDTAEDWSREHREQREMVVMPKLMDVQRRVSYRSAWMNYYRGLALSGSKDKKARKSFFYDTQAMVEQFVKGYDEYGVKHWGLILYGMASRELHQHEIADEFFKKAMGKNAPDDIHARALFERARNFADHAMTLNGAENVDADKVLAMFKSAEEAIDTYTNSAIKLLGKSYEVEVALNTAMLGSHLYETWAKCTRRIKEAAKLRAQAQDSLMGFLDKFDAPDVRAAFFQIIANKYRDRDDYEKLNSMILLAIAEDKTAKDASAEIDIAEKLLKMVLGRKDEISQKVRPQAMYSMAVIYIRRRMTRDAGEMFLKFAEENPEHPLAMLAADNAVRSYSTLIAERVEAREPVAAKLRERFIVTLEMLLGKWGDLPEFSDWYFHLGWQHQKLADSAAGEEALTACLQKAIAAYGKVPGNSMYILDAGYWSLGLRRKLMGDKADSADARGLVGELQRYASRAREAAGVAESNGKNARAKELLEWGAESAFLAQEVRYAVLDEKDQARAELRKLGDQWPGTRVLKRAAEFEILRLFAENNIDEASKAIEHFQEKYPKEAPELVQMLVHRIRARVENNRDNPKKAAQLAKDRETYAAFARSEYERVSKANTPADELYYFKQMYADSLVESANLPGVPIAVVDKGLALFNELVAANEAEHKKIAIVIDKEYADKLRDIDLVSSNQQKILAYKDEYFEILEDKLGLARGEISAAARLQDAVTFYEGASDNETLRQERLKDIAERLIVAYKKLRELEKRALPVDAGNFLGIARGHKLKKEYGESVEYYKKLIDGLDPNDNPREYWGTTLEMCKCVLEANHDNKEGLGDLRDFLKSLRSRDDKMGGLYSKFNAVKAEAEALLGK